MLGTFLSPGDLAFDIGAHVGVVAAQMVALGARVVAVEPQAHLITELRATGAQVLCAGVSSRAGVATLTRFRKDSLASLEERWSQGRFAARPQVGEYSIAVVTLDDLISAFGVPAFIKVDVEGHELDVFQGLSTPVAALRWEFIAEEPDRAHAVAKRLSAVDERYHFRTTKGSSDRWSSDWVTCDEVARVVTSQNWGDVYASLDPT